MNEALVFGALRQDELVEATRALNDQLREEIAERKQAEALLTFQKRALESVARGEPVARMIDGLARAMERQSRKRFLVAIHLLQEDGHHFGDVVSPSLPARYAEATRGMDARLQLGPCSASVVEHKATIVPDFAAETRWPEFSAEIVSLGLRGCFTTPILSSEGRILGTVAIYYREPGDHQASDRRLVEIGTRMASIAIERKRAEEKLRESEERFRTVFELGPVAIYCCDSSGVILEFNRRAAELWGRVPAAGDTDERFCGSFKMFRPDGSVMPHDQCPMAEVVTGKIGASCDAEVLIERPDGSQVTAIVNIRPLTNPFGEVTGAINCFYDITERKEAERYQNLLMNELAHRGKNLLAVVQAITARTLSGAHSLDEAREVLMKRIQTLAQSQSVLAEGGLQGAPIAEIVRFEVEGFSERVAASGPDIMLNPRHAQTFSLLVHELATNALKHGSLSTANGTVAIGWSTEGAGAGARFKFRWEECGGPPVALPTRRGFGRGLLEKAAALDFATTPKINFAPAGLIYEIDASLPHLAGG